MRRKSFFIIGFIGLVGAIVPCQIQAAGLGVAPISFVSALINQIVHSPAKVVGAAERFLGNYSGQVAKRTPEVTVGKVLGVTIQNQTTTPKKTSQVEGSLDVVTQNNYSIRRLVDEQINLLFANGLLGDRFGNATTTQQVSPASTNQTKSYGFPSAPVYVGYTAPNQTNNYQGATLFGATNVSGDNLIGQTGQFGGLTVTGQTTLAALSAATTTVTGSMTVTGTITASGGVTGSVNPGLTNGTVFFQGSSGITGDATRFLWDATYHRLLVGVATSTTPGTLTVQGSGSDSPFVVASSTGTSLFSILPTGKVGIGTTTPSGLVHIQAAAPLGNSSIMVFDRGSSSEVGFEIGTFAGTNFGLYNYTSASYIWQASDIHLLLLPAGSGNVGVGATSTPSATLSVTARAGVPPLTIASSTGTNLFNILPNGNVGIGTTTPAALLDIYGTSAFPLTMTNSTGATVLTMQSYRNGGSGFTRNSFQGKGARGTATSPSALLSGDDMLYLAATGFDGTAYGNGDDAQITFRTAEALTTSAHGAHILFSTTPLGTAAGNIERMRVTATGMVGINNTTPNATLAVQGIASSTLASLTITSSTGASLLTIVASGRVGIGTSTPDTNARITITDGTNQTLPTSAATVLVLGSSDGTTTGSSIRARGTVTGGLSDMGEYVKVDGDVASYKAGDVLAITTPTSTNLNDDHLFTKATTSYVSNLAGVVTETAGILAGGGDPTITYDPATGKPLNRVMIALSGRVPVKVTDENGPVLAGDYLTSSATKPGFAMRATKPGKVIGQALSVASEGKALMLVMNMYFTPTVSTLMQGSVPAALLSQNLGDAPAFQHLVVTDKLYAEGDIYVQGKLVTTQLQVGSSDAPAGITLFDTITHQPYCLQITNSQLVKVPGECNAPTGAAEPATVEPASSVTPNIVNQ